MKNICMAAWCVAALPVLAPAQCYGWGGHMGGWGIYMMFFWIVLLVIIGYGIVAFGRRRGAGGGAAGEPESALDILKKRYAKGEISKEQYENMKKDIER